VHGHRASADQRHASRPQRFRNRLFAPEVVSHVLAGVFEICANFDATSKGDCCCFGEFGEFCFGDGMGTG